ncbi:MAG: hypothetical protein QME75_13770 [Deltaproteobacteria bacterium]|nr:hypothetical protein [Deltaproteobacteria bacterium]
MQSVVCPQNCKDCYAVHVCAVRAIVSNNGGVSIDSGKCISCGSCSTACMTFGQKMIKPQKVKKQLSQKAA